MSHDWEFKAGMLVVCIDDAWPPFIKAEQRLGRCGFPEKGRVYTLRDVFIAPEVGVLVVRLCEIHNPAVAVFGDGRLGEPCWGAHRFRPLDESRLDVFRNLLVDLPKEEELA